MIWRIEGSEMVSAGAHLPSFGVQVAKLMESACTSMVKAERSTVALKNK